MIRVSSQQLTNSYAYDANGNMTCRTEDGTTYKQDYNTENRISAIHKMSGECISGAITEAWMFTYDRDPQSVGQVEFESA